MKKILFLFMLLISLVAFAACGDSQGNGSDSGSGSANGDDIASGEGSGNSGGAGSGSGGSSSSGSAGENYNTIDEAKTEVYVGTTPQGNFERMVIYYNKSYALENAIVKAEEYVYENESAEKLLTLTTYHFTYNSQGVRTKVSTTAENKSTGVKTGPTESSNSFTINIFYQAVLTVKNTFTKE